MSSSEIESVLSEMLTRAHLIEPDRLPDLVDEVARSVGARWVRVWLADYEQRALVAIGPDHAAPADMESSIAGRCFRLASVVERRHDDVVTAWVPLIDGVDRVGALEVEWEAARFDRRLLTLQASMVAAEVVGRGKYSDTFMVARRAKPMALAAEMQWGLLPPVSFATARVSIAGMVEPAYDVGGDAYDYAYQHEMLDIGAFDAVGHGLGSSLLAALAVGAYRNARRSGDDLEEMVIHIDEAIASQYHDASFATALLARLDVRSGHLRIVNAGHPPPLLIRQNRVVRTIDVPPRLPLGLTSRFSTATPAVVHEEALEPGDAVFFYTDGVVEARTGAGVDFGLARLSDFLERAMASGLAPAEIMRRLLHAVLDHHGGSLRDDATTLLCHWHPQGREQAVRGAPLGGAETGAGGPGETGAGGPGDTAAGGGASPG
jgi:hypothetical protein